MHWVFFFINTNLFLSCFLVVVIQVTNNIDVEKSSLSSVNGLKYDKMAAGQRVTSSYL